MIFDYPAARAERKHGPAGYAAYESYRPWLRDEFTYRCVYCLKRETWGQVTGDFDLDHFEPQSLSPERRFDYDNLVYACRRCNLVKLDQPIGDPLTLLAAESVVVLPDGSIDSDLLEVRRLIRQLDLNSPKMRNWRVVWMRIVNLAEEWERTLLQQLTGFPEDLPDLKRLRPPSNSRPEGLEACWFALRGLGQLPECY